MANIGYIQITRRCNQRCLFCSNPERDATMPLDDVKTKIQDLKGRAYSGIILTGGEPTLHPDLAAIITLVKETGLQPRLITNGQATAEPGYLPALARAGLSLITVSVYSIREETHDYLAANPGSLRNALQTIELSLAAGLDVNIATTINSYNADHLDETASRLMTLFPAVRHYTWNNLDPLMNRAADNPDTIPALWRFEISLNRAMSRVSETGRTFRVERVPLCYMAEFAHCSTETRKICKSEERTVHFLDEKGAVRQDNFYYEKAPRCAACGFNEICAGLFAMGRGYNEEELAPVFLDPQSVRARAAED